jgi:hypothetical protein
MQPIVGNFTSTFAPQLQPSHQSAIIKDVLDALAVVVGIGSAYAWNVGLYSTLSLRQAFNLI